MKTYLTLLVFIFFSFNLYSQVYLDIDVNQAKDTIEANVNNPSFTILDVRTSAEYLPEHIEGAFNRDFYATDFTEQLDSLDKNRCYLIYCRSGNRSGQTLEIMEDLGFQKVYNVLGGMNDWNAAGFPVTDVLPEFVDIYENTSGLDDESNAVFNVFPNPFLAYLSIDLSNLKKGTYSFMIMSSGGNIIHTEKNGNLEYIDLSFLDSGIFILIIYREGELIGFKKIIRA